MGAKKPLLPCLLISTILKDKPPRMLVRSQTLRLRESLTSQPLLLSLSDLTRLTVRLLLSMILEVVLSISPSSKFQVVFLKLSQLMEILLLEEKISIYAFKNTWLLNLKLNMVWTLPLISLLFKELEKPPKRQRLNFHPQLKLKSISLIFPLTHPAQSICNSASTDKNTSNFPPTLSPDP